MEQKYLKDKFQFMTHHLVSFLKHANVFQIIVQAHIKQIMFKEF